MEEEEVNEHSEKARLLSPTWLRGALRANKCPVYPLDKGDGLEEGKKYSSSSLKKHLVKTAGLHVLDVILESHFAGSEGTYRLFLNLSVFRC